MYVDTLGKVTIGIGNLIDTEAAAVGIRRYGATLRRRDGTEATDAEIRDEWQRVKNRTGPATLTLTEDGITNLLAGRAAEVERDLTSTYAEFSGFAEWPADAQLGLLSMAWAMGSRFAGSWPKLRANCAAADWLEAARNANMANDWLVKRNSVDRGLFRNAAWWTEQSEYDPQTLVIETPGSRPTLRLGDSDAEGADNIASVQRFLTWLGYPITDSGTFDADTEQAVRSFQTDEQALVNGSNFPIDGRVGPLTWAALGYLVPRA